MRSLQRNQNPKKSKWRGQYIIWKKKICQFCGRPFWVTPAIAKRNVKFCNRKCQSNSNKHVWHNNGYIMIYKPDHPHATKRGYIAQHRLIMERKLGRYLKKHEHAHHLDGNRGNNNIENLQLINIQDHGRLHAREYWGV